MDRNNDGTWRIDQVPAFCVTLERRSDRWKRFQDQYGIDALPKLKRFLGVDGKTIDIQADSRISTMTKRNILMKTRRAHEQLDSVGGVGCALSHIALWKWLAESNEEILLVMEDDALVPPDFVQRANQLIQESPTLKDPKKWDLWVIGAKWEQIDTIPGEYKTGLIKAPAFYMTHCYVITRQYAQKMYENCYPIEAHIDFWMSNFGIINMARIVATPRLQLKQAGAKSDIQSKKAPGLVDIPDNYEKTHTFISNTELMLARGAEAAVVLFLGYLAVSQIKKAFG
jgi:glycosyl transferase, family 25